MTLFTKGRAATVAAFAALAIVTAACSSDDASEPAASDGGMSSTMPSPQAMSTEFGAGCAAVPDDGAGSFEGMAMDPVATAASNNPALSTLVTAVTKAKLVDTLNGAEDVTVFAPTDDAFAALPAGTVETLLEDPSGDLTDILTYHVVPGAVPAADVVGLDGEAVTTVNGAAITIGVADDGAVTLTDAAGNDVAVVATDVQANNGVIHVIDAVLLPA